MVIVHSFPRFFRDHFELEFYSKELKPVSEIVVVEFPPLIDQATFDTVQTHLHSRNPKVTPPAWSAAQASLVSVRRLCESGESVSGGGELEGVESVVIR
ncbi:MAG TPA: hypothetical protein VHX61_06015 [Rhizomicrobium sp.]|nr:hypothetical protein [Rhizomicrobium sp.]